VFGAVAGKGSGGDAGVVDENVEPAVARVEVVVGGLVVCWFGDVEVKHVGVGTGGAEPGDGLFALRKVA